MTTRQKALAASSPGLLVLLVSVTWWAIDPKGDARQHLIDRGVRFADWAGHRLRDAARF